MQWMTLWPALCITSSDVTGQGVDASLSFAIMSSHPSPTTPSNPSPATPSHPRPLTLGSLVRHVTVQEQRIKPFLGKGKGFHLLDADEDMALLWEAVWGKTDLLIDVTMPVERGPNPVDDASIGEVVPKKCDVMVVPSAVSNCWDIGCEKILIRGEYEEAEQSVVSGSQQPRCHGIMVIGQPGIGFFFPLCHRGIS